jgi:Ca-activated chloride channel family protein
MMADFHFIRPEWLWAFVPLLMLLFWQYRQTRGTARWADFCDPELLPYILENQAGQSQRRLFYGAVLAAVLTVLALSGPTWKQLPAPVFRNEAALVIALSLSDSMQAADIKPTRLIRARYKIADILKQRKDGQTALLVYAGDAFTVTPLTEDNETILSQLGVLTPDLMPEKGDNALAALRLAEKLLQQAGLQQGDILLITDGSASAQLSELKPANGVRLSVLGVGTEAGAPIQTQGGGFLKDSQGNIWVPKLNSSALSDLAHQGGGLYQSLQDNDRDIEQLADFFERVNASRQAEGQNLLLEQWDDMGPWLLIFVLPLVALQFRKGILLLLVLPWPQNSQALDWNTLWKNADQQALQAFENQDYSGAIDKFTDPNWKAAALYREGQYQEAADLWKNDTSANGQYNLGNALAKTGQLEEAIKAYDQALKLKPDHQDALENRQKVEDLLKQQQQQQQQNDSKSDDASKDSQKDASKEASEKSDAQDQQSQDQQGESSEADAKSQNQNESQQGQQSQDPSADASSQSDDSADSDPSTEEAKPDETEPPASQSAQEESQNPQSGEDQTGVSDKEGAIDENRQADEQWLNRIVDDPGTLLKRKFQYQYQQRNRR